MVLVTDGKDLLVVSAPGQLLGNDYFSSRAL
jgi:hypothetical protein